MNYRLFPAQLLLALILGACTSAPPATSSVPSALPPATSPSSEENPGREAIITEIQNTVSARATQPGEFVVAQNGMSLSAGSEVQSGQDGRARVDLHPEGTIIRVAPNSSFTVPEITFHEGEPKTRIQLAVGTLFVLLKGGSVEVETPSGVASVRGSLLSVSYDPRNNKVIATCLEGHCSLENDAGEVELTDGQESYIEGEDEPVNAGPMDRESVQEWLDEIPELDEFLDELPDVEDYPESFEEEDGGDEEPEEGSMLPSIFQFRAALEFDLF